MLLPPEPSLSSFTALVVPQFCQLRSSSYARDQYCNRFSKLDWQDFCHYRSTAILPTCTTTMSKRAPSAPPKYNMAIEARTFELVHDASMAYDIAAESLLGDCDGDCLYTDRLTVHSRYEHMVIGAVPCIASNLTRGSTIACSHFSWAATRQEDSG